MRDEEGHDRRRAVDEAGKAEHVITAPPLLLLVLWSIPMQMPAYPLPCGAAAASISRGSSGIAVT